MRQIYEYSNYKSYLNALIFSQDKYKDQVYSEISQSIGVSKNFIGRVLDGPKHFSKEKLYYICVHFGLKNDEAKYLLVLLALNQASNWTEIDLLCLRLENLKHQIISKRIDEMTNIKSCDELLECA